MLINSNLNRDDQIFAAYIDDLINNIYEKPQKPLFTTFLNEREQSIATNILQKNNDIYFDFFGGYKLAERKCLTLYKENIEKSKIIYPIALLKITLNNRSTILEHGDFLGSILSLGIKREIIGDILLTEEKSPQEAYIFISQSFINYLLTNIIKIGKEACSVEIADINSVYLPQKSFEDITVIIASNRLDCYVTAICHMSREKSILFIKSGKVFINQQQCYDVAKKLNEEDILSLRGYGKYKLDKILGNTQKGRIKLNIKKY
jgi:RNA-binding protein YlmH